MGTTEEMFDGKPSALPAPVACGRALYRQEDGPAAVVRHIGGYGPFVEFCTGQGVRAEELASDPERLIWFLRMIGSQIESTSTLRAAAAAFVGNTIARLRPDAQWNASQGASPTVGNRERQFEIDRLLDAVRSADDDSVRGLVSMLSDWAQEEPDNSPAMQPLPVARAAGQPRYVRPHLPTTAY